MKDNLITELESLITRKAKELAANEHSHKGKYEYLVVMLLDMIQEAKSLKEDMDMNKLQVSSIEAEGYLRFALSVEVLLKD